ncbi:MAG: T9SS type A sorting domain-containing protein [Bacteroidetes bacterium]|nr:T9SS type A sorting domain-containing protein [Bacteroidota bacterium]
MPFTLTDSLTDNHNPRIAFYDEGLYSSGGLVFWERLINDSTTAIWMRNLTYMTPAEEVFYQEGVHFRNPHFFTFFGSPYPPDTLLYVFFESNLNGNYDIFLSKYSEDANFTTPELIFGSDGDEINLDVMGFSNIAWQNAGKIKVSEYLGGSNFAEPLTIDSINCQNPCLGENIIVYEKTINDSSRIYYALRDINYVWGEPDTLYNRGHNTSIGFTGSDNQPFSMNTLVWENFNASEWTIFGTDLYDLVIVDMEISSDEPLYPKALFIDIPILNDGYLSVSHLTYSKSENGAREIFANSDWLAYQNCYNISNSETVDTKPYIDIGGYYFGTYHIYDIWERYINGHWQLMASKLDMQVDIDENNQPDMECDISIYPNPFSEQLNIHLPVSINEDITVNIYNFSGMIIRSFYEDSKLHLNWDRKDQKGHRVPAGLYFIEILSGDQRFFKKALVSN